MQASAPVITDVEAGASAAAPPRAGWALAVLSLTILSSGIVRNIFSPLQEVAKRDLRLDDFHISLAQGVAASIPIAILAIPLGRLTDRSNRVRLLIGLTVIWTLGTLLTAFAQDFNMLFLGRMLAGLGGNSAVPVAVSFVADLCVPQKRGGAMVAISVAQIFGVAAAFALGGVVFTALAAPGAAPIFGLAPWRATLAIFGVVSALLLAPLLLIREPVRHETVGASRLGPAMAAVWARKGFLLPLFVGQIGVVMADVAGGIWAAPVLTRDFHLAPGQFAPILGGVILLSGILGAVLGGLGADIGQKRRYKGGILVGAVIAALLTIPAGLFPLMPSVSAFCLALGVLLLCGAVAGTITATAIAVLIPNDLRGLCLSGFVIVASVVGLGVAPTIVTLASTALGGESHLAVALAATGVIASAVSFAGFLVAMLRAPARVEAAA